MYIVHNDHMFQEVVFFISLLFFSMNRKCLFSPGRKDPEDSGD